VNAIVLIALKRPYTFAVLATTVGNIEHIESESLYGRGIVKIFFQPGTDVAAPWM